MPSRGASAREFKLEWGREALVGCVRAGKPCFMSSNQRRFSLSIGSHRRGVTAVNKCSRAVSGCRSNADRN